MPTWFVRRVVGCIVLMLMASFAEAEDFCPNPENPKNQLELNFCAAKAFREADDGLQSVYNEIKVRVTADPVFQAMLASSHSSWVAYRDAQCLFALGPRAGGSSEPWARYTCMERLTQLRLEEMKPFLACEEGSLLCSVPPVK
jgi:uncharacterized protein YecT (DUF1311 family)